MKCLLTADLHYRLKQWDWLNEVADRFDLVVIAGDLLDIASIVQTEVQAVVVMKYLRRIGARTRLLVSSGNHDFDARTAGNECVTRWLADSRPAGVLVDEDSLATGDWLFTICPWRDGPETEAVVAALLQRDAARRKRHWVWVYHSPPDGMRVSWTGKSYFGDPRLGAWIEEYGPSLVLSGHVHQSPFRSGGSWVDRLGKTWVFNAGQQIGPNPAFVLLDLETGQASWHSLAGEETLDLWADLNPEPA